MYLQNSLLTCDIFHVISFFLFSPTNFQVQNHEMFQGISTPYDFARTKYISATCSCKLCMCLYVSVFTFVSLRLCLYVWVFTFCVFTFVSLGLSLRLCPRLIGFNLIGFLIGFLITKVLETCGLLVL